MVHNNILVTTFMKTSSCQIIQMKCPGLSMTKAIISGLRCVNEGHEFLKKNMKPPSMYWGITIFTNFDVRVGEKRQFLSDSKTHEF